MLTAAKVAVDEAPYGVWCWAVEIFLINLWIPMDLWLGRNNHEFMTSEFKEGLNHPLWGPLIVGLLAFSVGAFLWHMFHSQGRIIV